MTARPDRPAEPLARPPASGDGDADFAGLQAMEHGRPPAGEREDDGRDGGQVHHGRPAAGVSGAETQGLNAQSGETAGNETERDSPGSSTGKKADDIR